MIHSYNIAFHCYIKHYCIPFKISAIAMIIASSKRLAVLALLVSRSSAFTVGSVPRFGRNARLWSTTSQNVEEMRAGDIKKELESYGISTKSFLEKKELIDALRQARSEGRTPKAPEASSTTTSTSSSPSTDGSASPPPSSSNSSRDNRLAQEMEACNAMKAGEIKKELENMGISTKSFFEKSEFVKALAIARVDGIPKKNSSGNSSSSSSGGEGYAEYANVEVLTDDSSGPRKRQSEQPEVKQQSPFGGGGMPDMGGMAGIADMLKNMGMGSGSNPFGGMGGGANPFGGMGGGGDVMGKAQEMLKNPKVREIMAKAQSNPKIMAALQECMSNPAAFLKYQNDPEVGELVNELKKYIM